MESFQDIVQTACNERTDPRLGKRKRDTSRKPALPDSGWRKVTKLTAYPGASVLLFLCMLAAPAFGQTAAILSIPMQSGTSVRLQEGSTNTFGGRYVVIQFSQKLRPEGIDRLRLAGINPLSLVYMNSWLCAVGPSALRGSAPQAFGIVAVAPWQPEYKISASLRRGKAAPWAFTAGGELKLLVTFFGDVKRDEMESVLARYDPSYMLFRPPNVWALQIPPSRMEDLLREAPIHTVEAGPQPLEPVNDRSRALINVDAVQNIVLPSGLGPPDYLGLTGKGVNIAVSEEVDSTHPDFWDHDSSGSQTTSRCLNCGYGSLHGTHVAGTIGGNGWNSARNSNPGSPFQWRGMAPEATLINGEGYGSYEVDASNHSYVMDYGNYGISSYAVDLQVRGAAGLEYQRPHIYAAANQGLTAQYGMQTGYYSMYCPAKNAICVGAVNANDGSLAGFSSLGPTFDGRIKPDVVAGGSNDMRPRSFDQTRPVTVDIDYIRIVDGNGNTLKSWEFNTDGDLEGWFAQESWQIDNPRVANGTLSFETQSGKNANGLWVNGYGFVENVNFAAASDQVISMRYRIQNQYPDPYSMNSTIYWARPGNYADGLVSQMMTIDGQFHTVQFPVGPFGFQLDSSFNVIGLHGWSGTINRLRIDPLSGSPSIVSTMRGSGAYIGMGGTSMAAPAVTGMVALMLQQFVRKGKWFDQNWETVALKDNPPLPSTIKAILIQTAKDLVHDHADLRDPNNPDTGTPVLYYQGPDFATGYGLVNAEAAVNLIADAAGQTLIRESEFSVDRLHVYDFDLPTDKNGNPTITPKVTLAWDDVEGSTTLDQRLPRLVNDLDLVLADPSGHRHYPWTLDPVPEAACKGQNSWCGDPDPIKPADVRPAKRAPDHRNNVEQVQPVINPPGKWQVLVAGRDIQYAFGPQTYSLGVEPSPRSPRGCAALRCERRWTC